MDTLLIAQAEPVPGYGVAIQYGIGGLAFLALCAGGFYVVRYLLGELKVSREAFLVALKEERDGRTADRETIVAAVDELAAEVRNINGQGGSGFGHGSNGAHRGDRGSRG